MENVKSTKATAAKGVYIDSLAERLLKVQSELKAPKGQQNKFGNYKYRSCEDILEAVKPLLKKNELTLTISDEIQQIGDRYYVNAVAIVTYAGESVAVEAFAREEEVKKGMDSSQITGAASSYARKYALNGLFLIDDTKDSDATNTGEQAEPMMNARQKAYINLLLTKNGVVDADKSAFLLKEFGDPTKFTATRADEVIKTLEETKGVTTVEPTDGTA